jgi:hypothetical protein
MGTEFTVSEEFVRLRNGDSSATQEKEKVRHWKPLPEDWWKDNRSSNSLHAVAKFIVCELAIAP